MVVPVTTSLTVHAALTLPLLWTIYILPLLIRTTDAWTIAAQSRGGRDYQRPQKVNQDAYFCLPCFDKNHNPNTFKNHGNGVGFTVPQHLPPTVIAGVLDGHGLRGHELTHFLAETAFPQLLCQEYPYLRDSIDGTTTKGETNIHLPRVSHEDLASYNEQVERLGGLALPNGMDNSSTSQHRWVRIFHSAQILAMKEPTINASRNGCACLVLQLTEDAVTVAQVGDARALVVTDTSFRVLSTETNLDKMPSERQRIEQGQGRMVDGTNHIFYGPQGIAMTRSLGNAAMLRAGIIPTPVIHSHTLEKDTLPKSTTATSTTTTATRTYVLASDGVWDVLSNERVAHLVLEGLSTTGDLQLTVDAIVQEATNAWIGDLPLADESSIDDITCLLIHQGA